MRIIHLSFLLILNFLTTLCLAQDFEGEIVFNAHHKYVTVASNQHQIYLQMLFTKFLVNMSELNNKHKWENKSFSLIRSA